MDPRGIRNNNPGNIRRSDDQWRGLAADQTDADFFRFAEPRFGIRAMARILQVYQEHHGLRTIREIINRWAPSVENPTGDYVTAVAIWAGFDAASGAAVGILTDVFGLSPEIASLLPTALTSLSEDAAAVVVLVIGLAGAAYSIWARRDDKLKGRL